MSGYNVVSICGSLALSLPEKVPIPQNNDGTLWEQYLGTKLKEKPGSVRFWDQNWGGIPGLECRLCM